jgi:hypothetical protein
MIFEYFGPSGAGKTHASQEQSRAENIPTVSIKGKWEKLFHVLFFALSHPAFFFRMSIKIWLESRQDFAVWSHKYFFLFLSAIAKENKATYFENAILDEGLYQFGLSLYERRVDSSEMDEYVSRLVNFPERILYFVETDASIREERMLGRNRIPRAKFGRVYAHLFQEVLAHNAEVLRKRVNCKTVDGAHG